MPQLDFVSFFSETFWFTLFFFFFYILISSKFSFILGFNFKFRMKVLSYLQQLIKQSSSIVYLFSNTYSLFNIFSKNLFSIYSEFFYVSNFFKPVFSYLKPFFYSFIFFNTC